MRRTTVLKAEIEGAAPAFLGVLQGRFRYFHTQIPVRCVDKDSQAVFENFMFRKRMMQKNNLCYIIYLIYCIVSDHSNLKGKEDAW